MAQYKRNFYGTSYYGNTNAFSGTFESEEILTEENLKGTFDVNITTVLPQAVYDRTTVDDLTLVGTWTVEEPYSVSNESNAKIVLKATSDRIVVYYESRPDGASVAVKLTTTVPGEASTITNYTIDTYGVTMEQASYTIDNLAYGMQEVELSLSNTNPTNKYLYFKSIEARVTGFTVETRARLDSGTWTNYVKIAVAKTPITGRTDAYTITGTTPNYLDNNKVQVRVWMASSDNDVSPTIEKLDTYAGNTNNYTEDGTYLVLIDMQAVASPLTVTFQEITNIDWQSTEPMDTKLTIRSRTRANLASNVWSDKTVPYSKAANRIRLKDGITDGYLITPIINPASINTNLRINQWMRWDDVSHLPWDESDVGITYFFLDETGKVLHKVEQPKYVAKHSFVATGVTNKPYRIKMQLTRRFDRSSPVVESVSIQSDLIYEERKITEKLEFSAVDNLNSGKQMILDMATFTFDPPAEATTRTYHLEDKTERPLDVSLYYESTMNTDVISRPLWTTMSQDKVWAETKPTVLKHFQYGGGTARYQFNDETQMATAFTPTLEADKHYRYYLTNGWYNPEKETFIDGSVNSAVATYWKSEESDTTQKHLTKKSSHNVLLDGGGDLTSDTIIAKVSALSTWGEVPWISEEKIYFGSCNLNDTLGDYIRQHDTPESGDSVDTSYMVRVGDTYPTIASAFGIDEEDLKSANNVIPGTGPIVGKTILIPSRIVLPAINPAATIGVNPYEISVVYNSVRQGARAVGDARINRIKLEVIETQVTINKEEVVRGDLVNGKDLLKSARVKEIVGIWTLPNDPVLAPNYEKDLDYKLVGNQISWELTVANSREPVAGSKYYVTYKCMKPTGVRVIIGSDYQEEGGIDRIWRSSEVRKFSGTCAPEVDFQAELPPISEWQGSNDPEIEDMEYLIEDNDLWVKTWIHYDRDKNKYYANGSLQDRIPKDNWFPTIKTGHYYLGKEEYYLFSEPITFEPKANEIPKAQNIKYVPGRFNNAAYFQSGASNLLKNSGFDVTSSKGTVFFRSFNTQEVPSGN